MDFVQPQYEYRDKPISGEAEAPGESRVCEPQTGTGEKEAISRFAQADQLLVYTGATLALVGPQTAWLVIGDEERKGKP